MRTRTGGARAGDRGVRDGDGERSVEEEVARDGEAHDPGAHDDHVVVGDVARPGPGLEREKRAPASRPAEGEAQRGARRRRGSGGGEEPGGRLRSRCEGGRGIHRKRETERRGGMRRAGDHRSKEVDGGQSDSSTVAVYEQTTPAWRGFVRHLARPSLALRQGDGSAEMNQMMYAAQGNQITIGWRS